MSDFVFVLEDGMPKRSCDMTREELLQVIDHVIGERRWWQREAKNAAAFGDMLVMRRPEGHT